MRMDASFLWRVFIIGVLSSLFVTDVQADAEEMIFEYEDDVVSATFVGVSQFAAHGEKPLKHAAQMKGQKLPYLQWGANKAWRMSSGGTISLHQAKKIRPSFAYMAQEPRRLFVKYTRGAVQALSVMDDGDGGLFELGVLGRDFCVNGDVIQDAGRCRAAATELGLVFGGGVNHGTRPRGCISDPTQKVFFNNASPGRSNPDRAPVCNLRAFDVRIDAGTSSSAQKVVRVEDKTWLDCPLEWKQGGATFKILTGVPFVDGYLDDLLRTAVVVTRTDASTGWNFNLRFTCKKTSDSSPSAWIDRSLNKYVHAMDGFVKCQQGVAKVAGIAGKIGLAGATFDEVRRLVIWIFKQLTELTNRISKNPVSNAVKSVPVYGKFIHMGAKVLNRVLKATKPLRETLFAAWGKFKMFLLQFNTAMAGIDVAGSATAAYVVGNHRALLQAKRCADRNTHAWRVGHGGWELEQEMKEVYPEVARDMNRIHDSGLACGIVFEPLYEMLDAVNDFLQPLAKLREPISEFTNAANAFVTVVNKCINAVMESDAFQCAAAVFKPLTALADVATCPVDEVIGAAFHIAQDVLVDNLDKLLMSAMDAVLITVVDVMIPDDFTLSMPAIDEQGTLMDPRWLDQRFGECELDGFTGVFFPQFAELIDNIMANLPMELDGKSLERLILDELLFNAGDDVDFSVDFDDYDSACVEAWNNLIEAPDFSPCMRLAEAIGCAVAGAALDAYDGLLDVAIGSLGVLEDLLEAKILALDALNAAIGWMPWMGHVIAEAQAGVRTIQDEVNKAAEDVEEHKQEVNDLNALREWSCGDKSDPPPEAAFRALGFAFPPTPYTDLTPEAVVPDAFQEIGNGYCKDWIYPSTGTQLGAYDDMSSTAQGCMERCSALNPAYTSFYLKGTKCGCSTTTQGACALKGHSPYTAYVFNPKTFKKIGNGFCSDWVYPTTGTKDGVYDDLSSTAQGCMERCLALDPDYTSFYLRGTQCGCSTTKNGVCALTSNGGYTAYTLNPSLGGPNASNPSNLQACIGECDRDSECANGLKCFQRSGFTPIPGCNGVGNKDWDYCYDPHGSIELSGGNDNSATDLLACTGECDNDEDCAFGLKCFQRQNGETIPGCKGSGSGGDWDYCYYPSWTAGTELARGKPTAQSSTGWGGSSSRAVDGNTSGHWGHRSTTHTHKSAKEWWRVDLQLTADISSVHIWNRLDCCVNRIDGATIKVGATDNVDFATPCAFIDSISGSKGFNCVSTGRFVFVQGAPNEHLSLAEVKVFGKIRTGPLQLGLTDDSNARNVPACSKCTSDSQCANGLKCFKRNGNGHPVPGCKGSGVRDWDYCYDPTGSIELSGGNDNSATHLPACRGECDRDTQCADGLECFQRDHGETIPGCKGSGRGPTWDYCYDPTWSAAKVEFRAARKEKCIRWGQWSKHDMGCRAYFDGWEQKSSNSCSSCSSTRRAFGGCDSGECNAFCDDIYRTSGSARRQCKEGCAKAADLGGCRMSVAQAEDVEVVIGSSTSNSKTVIADVTDCPAVVDRNNWVTSHTYGDTFSVKVFSGSVTVKRTDSTAGWGMPLRIMCTRPAWTLTRFHFGKSQGVTSHTESYHQQAAFCESNGGRLPTRDELCPSFNSAAESRPALGCEEGDSWVPYAGGANNWMSIGCSGGHYTCKDHVSHHGAPRWRSGDRYGDVLDCMIR